MAQLPAFQYCTDEPLFVDCTVEQRQWLTFAGQPLELTLVLIHIVICMAIMKFWPKTPKIGKWIPASLVALLVGTLIEWTLFRMAIGQGTRVVSMPFVDTFKPTYIIWRTLCLIHTNPPLSLILFASLIRLTIRSKKQHQSQEIHPSLTGQASQQTILEQFQPCCLMLSNWQQLVQWSQF